MERKCNELKSIYTDRGKISFFRHTPLPEEYNYLRKSSKIGPERSMDRIEKGLGNSEFIVCAYDESNKITGLGRIVGDGAMSYAVSDIMVAEDFQGLGIGKAIMEIIDSYLECNTDETSFVMLIANKPADMLYEKFNFMECDDRVGMLRKKK